MIFGFQELLYYLFHVYQNDYIDAYTVCACHIRFQLHHWLVACCEKVVKIFNASIVKAAKESIPRGVRKDYKPYWSNEMQKTHDELTRAREKAETNSSLENNIKLH